MDYSSVNAFFMPNGLVLREAKGVGFGFYTSDEMRKLSVKEITCPDQRDTMNRPLEGGLYDPALGPTDHYESCVTCGLDYSMCPGHFGHIELALPTYGQLLFPLLHQLLRGTCLHCGHFRMKSEALDPFVDALALFNAGLLTDAATLLEHGRSARMAKSAGEDEDDEEEPAAAAADKRAPTLSDEAFRVLRTPDSRRQRSDHCRWHRMATVIDQRPTS